MSSEHVRMSQSLEPCSVERRESLPLGTGDTKSQNSGLASGLVGLWGPFQGQALALVLGDPKTSTSSEGISRDWDAFKFTLGSLR